MLKDERFTILKRFEINMTFKKGMVRLVHNASSKST